MNTLAEVFHRRTSIHRVLVVLLAVGVIFIVCDQAIDPLRTAEPWNHLLTAFADAFIVTGVIGLLVEIPFRAISNEDLSKAVFYAVFGIRAPNEYFDQLRGVCQTDCLCYATKWDIRLNWHEQPSTVAVELEASVTTHNISRTPAEQRGVWIMGSAAGTRGSRLVRYSLRFEDDKGNVHHFPDHDEAQLQALMPSDRQPEDPISIEIGSIIGQNRFISPGGRSVAVTRGVVYLPNAGMVPMVQRFPTMGTSFFIGGDALGDLDVSIKSGTNVLQPDRKASLLGFSEPDLALPGTTFRLEFAPDRRQAAGRQTAQG
jgi:hypothetical protein